MQHTIQRWRHTEEAAETADYFVGRQSFLSCDSG